MKKFLAMATVVGAAFTSCVNDNEAVYQQEENPQPITFEVAKYKAASRGEVTFPIGETFGTFAYYENSAVSGHTVYMNNVQIGYKSGVDITPYWGAIKGEYMWPHQGHLDFVSYYPYEAYEQDVDINGDPKVDGEGKPVYKQLSNAVPRILDTDVQQTLKYETFKVDAANPVDLMYSDKAVSRTANTNHYGFNGVPTLFHHALAKLSFYVKAQRLNNSASSPDAVTNWKVKVKSIIIDGIYDEGTVELKTNQQHSTSAAEHGWVNARKIADSEAHNTWNTTSSTTSKEWKPTVPQELTIGEKVFGSGTSDEAFDYFVLPQVLISNQQKITVVYEVDSTSPEGQNGVAEYTVTKSFSEYTSVVAWEMGKYIKYVIQIDPAGDIINFAPAVFDWEEMTGQIVI